MSDGSSFRLQQTADRITEAALTHIAAYLKQYRRLPRTADILPLLEAPMRAQISGLSEADTARVMTLFSEGWICRVAAELPKLATPLRYWALVGQDGDASFRGLRPDGQRIDTSRIEEKVAPLTYRTESGSLYRLDGPADPGFVRYLAGRGIPLNPEDPIVFKDRPSAEALN